MISYINNKIKKIFNNKKYEKLEIELPDDQILFLCLEAHKQDITLNQLCNNILIEQLDKIKNVYKI